jgi:hypothetical protein
MGKIEKGILGGFSGKVGTVIGATWKGIAYMRSLSAKRNFVPSLKQLEQQLKFALVMRFLQPMSALLEISFKDYAVKQTGINSAFAYTFENAITGAYPAYTIDYSLVLISRGTLPNVLGPAVVMGAGSILTFSWTDNSGMGGVSPDDQAILVAYCPDMKQAIYTTAGGDRSAATGSLNLVTFTSTLVETYIGFISADGKTVANSIFTGEVKVS